MSLAQQRKIKISGKKESRGWKVGFFSCSSGVVLIPQSKESVSLEIKTAFCRGWLFVNAESKQFPRMALKCIPALCQVLCVVRQGRKALRPGRKCCQPGSGQSGAELGRLGVSAVRPLPYF